MSTEKTKNGIIQQHADENWQKISAAGYPPELLAKHQDSIKAIAGLSPFVTEVALTRPVVFSRILANNWHLEIDIDSVCEQFNQRLSDISSEEELLVELRLFRAEQMAALAWRDLTNQQSIEVSLSQTSLLADTLIMAAYNWLYASQIKRYGEPQGPEGPQPMLILGMGKLGGKELNFSSDIDLIFAYPYKGETDHPRKPIENQQFFTKLAQRLIAALNKTTPYGQVFRVDMRLRPFGDSGPLVAHFAALEDYYQEQGRQWERYAMIKARVLNPDSAYSAQLQAILAPFVYRRYLDFTTIDAIREMKQLINKELRRRRLTNNIKLGAGGIREVEFFAQSFQLIHGGRETTLQSKQLLPVLHRLAELQIVETQAIEQLIADYYFLRKAEHTLQQFNDEQTQLLPDNVWTQQVLANTLDFPDYEAFLAVLEQVMARVHSQFNALVAEPGDEQQQQDSLFSRCKDAWQIGMHESEFTELLDDALDATSASALYTQLTSFKQQLSKHRIGQRGEDTLNKLMPEVVYYMLRQCPADSVILLPRLFSVISAITGRTTYLDLLHENPDVLKQLIKLCARSEWITEQIRTFPLLLDELLTPLYLQQQQTDIAVVYEQYSDELRQSALRVEPEDTEQLMEQWRQFKLCQQLRIAASDISGSLPIARVSDKLTILAEVLLKAVFTSAWQQVTEKFGAPNHLQDDDTGFLIVGYGKLGGYELGYGSDLDLVFIHNAPQGAETTGPKQVSAQQFYIKLAQRIMHLLNTRTLSGQLYEADLRLRPSGNSGLLCCHLSGFTHYQLNEAWTWEHQALVRARSIMGDKQLQTAFTEIRNSILTRQRNLTELADEVVKMRLKMRDHLLDSQAQGLDLKQCEGGITDIEFMVQYWVLGYAHQYPALTQWPDNLRILENASQAGLLSPLQSEQLQNAYLTLRDHYHQLTLAGEKFAHSNEELETVRTVVTTQWQQVFGSILPEE
ncbi:bifunctional [glutamate--ammonia ligase]-adenylyl-L-tyrosine phosphorylase/[glutamate--ammonia-ligase] adenylyltransferase [Alteromonas lipolytica]|uniref:Bifunctional glutamine synthetase adenylyltransferase/adenylyl-removing enzyme n=1 Tax=Alteromonas lipolytica TaxID=1856405 RepID=A0A1E8FDP9_9ALTE|nr:bifunctional [glutamate--ammonia ligase]-adenylyl-L-tyrosine phosphorylase/[glutamate--ammonia-ligase] adenylyltransferase [Alteromonas lipolytica]OFI34039.1 bifunctional glutamine synthetase adenylyltransferase/deadenyltransferase [Alteromonas lipolytica]GGF65978.1 glutamate-ammonia-ligase adenylyltransferase [Alteromonas lipolytica]